MPAGNGNGGMLFMVCCSWYAVHGMLFMVCCSWYAVHGMLFMVCCSWFLFMVSVRSLLWCVVLIEVWRR